MAGASDVSSSNVRSAVCTSAGISGRAQAAVMDSLGLALCMAAMKPSELAAANALRYAAKPFLSANGRPRAFEESQLAHGAPKTAMISGVLERLGQDAL